jgi:hypothetical protein
MTYVNGNTQNITLTLKPAHLAQLHQSAITDDVISERNYFSVDDSNSLLTLGFINAQTRPGLVLPLWTPDGRIGTWILRPDNPRCFDDKKKPRNPDGTYPQKVLKYETPRGSGLRIDCPPRCKPDILNPKKTLYITEGIKKGDALASAGLCAIDLLGVWGAKGKNEFGASTWLTEWGFIALKDRVVVIVFDSDIMTNSHVKDAFDSLNSFLTYKGARVRAINLPSSPSRKIGVDDYLAAGHTAADLEAMITLPQAATPQPKVTSVDYYKALQDLGWSFRMNALNDMVEVNGRPVTDSEEAVILTALRDQGFTNVPAVRDAITALAYRNGYHPIQAYFKSLPKYDGYPYINILASCIKTDNKNAPVYLKRWLIGAVRRVFEGGTQNRVLVLAGGQNIGKSKFVEWLCPKPLRAYFLASPIYPEVKDQKLTLMSTWIWEVAELGNTTRKADREALKFFLTLEQIKERFPYGRRPVIKPAITSFIGTLNDEGGVLTDPTGSRRFMFLKVDSIDWRKYTTTITSDLVWAEAYHRYMQGETADLTQGESDMAATGNSEFDMENPVEGLLLKFFKIEPDNRLLWTPTAEITRVLLDPYQGAYHGTSDKLTKDLASILTGLECLKVRKESWLNPIWNETKEEWEPSKRTDQNFDYSSKVTGYLGVIEK